MIVMVTFISNPKKIQIKKPTVNLVNILKMQWRIVALKWYIKKMTW